MTVSYTGNRGHVHEVHTTDDCPFGHAVESFTVRTGPHDQQIDGISTLTQISDIALLPCGHHVRGFTLHDGHMRWHQDANR